MRDYLQGRDETRPTAHGQRAGASPRGRSRGRKSRNRRSRYALRRGIAVLAAVAGVLLLGFAAAWTRPPRQPAGHPGGSSR